MEYVPNDLTPRERYKVLTSFVLPRPIAWVTTVGPTGVVNAAPFSFFNVFCENPPLCMFAVNRRPDGRVKDAKILRSIPLLDQAALDAVKQWEFTPTLLNGVPVPVIMTVTVNFTLQ